MSELAMMTADTSGSTYDAGADMSAASAAEYNADAAADAVTFDAEVDQSADDIEINSLNSNDFDDLESAIAMDEVRQQAEQTALRRALEEANMERLWQEVSKRTEARQAQQPAGLQLSSRTASWVDLFRQYPNLEPKDISVEVYRRVNAGQSPILAMQSYELEQTKQQLAALQRNQQNRAKDIGSVVSDMGDDGDSFLSGFLEG